MRVLEVSRYKSNFADHQLPFVTEQGEAIARELRNRVNSEELTVKSREPSAVEYFLVKGNYIKAVGALKAKIREFQPDIVHAHFELSAITAELLGLDEDHHGSDCLQGTEGHSGWLPHDDQVPVEGGRRYLRRCSPTRMTLSPSGLFVV